MQSGPQSSLQAADLDPLLASFKEHKESDLATSERLAAVYDAVTADEAPCGHARPTRSVLLRSSPVSNPQLARVRREGAHRGRFRGALQRGAADRGAAHSPARLPWQAAGGVQGRGGRRARRDADLAAGGRGDAREDGGWRRSARAPSSSIARSASGSCYSPRTSSTLTPRSRRQSRSLNRFQNGVHSPHAPLRIKYIRASLFWRISVGVFCVECTPPARQNRTCKTAKKAKTQKFGYIYK